MSLLACSINGADITLRPTPGSLLSRLHGRAESVVEHTTCNYGLELSVQELASSHGMTVAGLDDLNEVRAVERSDHPFFVATLYQPQLRSELTNPHPVFVGLVRAAGASI